MNGSAAKYWLILSGTLAAAYGSFVAWRHVHPEAAPSHATARYATPSPSPESIERALASGPLEDFELTDQDGKKFDSRSLHGKVWVASFFFTNCSGSCWRLNQALAAIQEANPTSQVRYISITCDPDNDTPQALAKYAKAFQADFARWTFLTGDFKKIQRIATDFFRVGLDRATHSDRAFVVDREGKVRGRFLLTEPNQVEMLTRLANNLEPEPAPISNESPSTPTRSVSEGT
jgi:cytochrome oxidase Cu insertion factor (SCO1/SenC/PrrC family)